MARVVLDQAELNQLLRSPEGETGAYLVRTATAVLNQARARCPVDTGNLRGSLTYEIARDGRDLSARVGTNVPYAIYVHEGTRGRAGVPFLTDALASVAL